MGRKKNNDKRLKNLISLYVSDLLYDKIKGDVSSTNNRHNSMNSLINEILEKHYNLYGKTKNEKKHTNPEILNTGSYFSWYKGAEEDDETMQNDHIPLFLVMIDRMVEKDLSQKTVFDFGCNQGLFLRMLYRIRSFEKGYGVDLLEESIRIANNKKSHLPIEYYVTDDLSKLKDNIDIAFSHEVVYLLPDLDKHSQDIHRLLKDGGSYYAVLGRHTDNPLWESWKTQIENKIQHKVQNYSLDDVYDAFERNGFEAYAQKFMLNDFVKIKKNKHYFNKVSDGLDFYWDYKTLFRFVKK